MGNWASSAYTGTATSFFELSATALDGGIMEMSRFTGKVVLVSNVASFCGLSKRHYQEFTTLDQRYKDLEIIGFPSNQFNQESSDPEKIRKFVQSFGGKWKLTALANVNGKDTHPVLAFCKLHSGFGTADKLSSVKWNFGKWLIDRNGKVRAYHGPKDYPLNWEGEIKALLDEKAERPSDDDENTSESPSRHRGKSGKRKRSRSKSPKRRHG